MRILLLLLVLLLPSLALAQERPPGIPPHNPWAPYDPPQTAEDYALIDRWRAVNPWWDDYHAWKAIQSRPRAEAFIDAFRGLTPEPPLKPRDGPSEAEAVRIWQSRSEWLNPKADVPKAEADVPKAELPLNHRRPIPPPANSTVADGPCRGELWASPVGLGLIAVYPQRCPPGQVALYRWYEKAWRFAGWAAAYDLRDPKDVEPAGPPPLARR